MVTRMRRPHSVSFICLQQHEIVETDGEQQQRLLTLHDSNKYMLEKKKSCDVIIKIRRRPSLIQTPAPLDEQPGGISRDYPDVTGQVHSAGDDVTASIYAHMYVLRARCPGLAGLANKSTNSMPAPNEPSYTIDLDDDVTEEAIQEILRFLISFVIFAYFMFKINV